MKTLVSKIITCIVIIGMSAIPIVAGETYNKYYPKHTEAEVQTASVSDASVSDASMSDAENLTTGWIEGLNGWEYYDEEGNKVYDTWIQSEDGWYYIDVEGYLFTDGQTPDGYEVDENGLFKDMETDPSIAASYRDFKYAHKGLRLNTGSGDIIWNYLKKKGWTDTAIAGIMGNFQQESGGMRPEYIESNGIGFGLGQWSFERRTNLEKYAQSKGKSASDIYIQLDFMMIEKTESKFVSKYSKTNWKSAAEACIEWDQKWERHKADGSLNRVRIPYAMAYYAYYAQGVNFVTVSYPFVDIGEKTASDSEAELLENTIPDDEEGVEVISEEESRLLAQTHQGTGWVRDTKGWWYNTPGTYPKSCWKQIGKYWYRFDENGYILRNCWFTDDDGCNYEFDNEGHIVVRDPDTGEILPETEETSETAKEAIRVSSIGAEEESTSEEVENAESSATETAATETQAPETTEAKATTAATSASETAAASTEESVQ